MNTLAPPALTLTSLGHPLSTDPAHFGPLRASDAAEADPGLRSHLAEDGYVYLPGFLPRDLVLAARAALCARLALAGLLDPTRPPLEAVIAPGRRSHFKPELARDNPAVHRVVRGPEVMTLFARLLGAPIRAYDYVWVRAVGPGHGTTPHCDLVYMGRGTSDVLTCWIPYGDVPLELGGLIVLEQSHRQADRLRNYLSRDVDAYCTNRPAHLERIEAGRSIWSGALTKNPHTLRARLGGRWLTADWRAGDVIAFKMSLVHGSLDNRTDRIRLSTDTRYQRADDPIDERWIGDHPAGHGRAGKRGRVC